jgi:nitrite reductase/ring-hydroxylating ferredoxin subunit
MPPYVVVSTVEAIPPGTARAFAVGAREIAVFNIDGRFYAIENVCPHQGGPLAEGWIEGCIVTCPWHGWCFDVTSGRMTLGEFATVDAFDVQVEGSAISVCTEPRT